MSLLKIEPDAGIFLGPELKPKISTESPPTNMFGSDAQKWITSMGLASGIAYSQHGSLKEIKQEFLDLIGGVRDFVDQLLFSIGMDHINKATEGNVDNGA